MTRQSIAVRQSSLFDTDSPLHGKVRGEKSVMDFPFFTLSKNPQLKPIEYRHDGVVIQIRPSATGVATMYDKEILLYVASLMVQAIARGEEVGTDFTFTAHDYFLVTGVARPSKRDYDRFADALERLQGTQIKTNIETGSEIDRGWFSWLSEAQAKYRKSPKTGEEQLRLVKVRICEWLHRAIKRDGRIYHYHHEYFRLGAIERRLYEIAHCHCEGGELEISLEALWVKVGSTGTLRKFKLQLKDIAAENKLPEYTVELLDVVPAEPRRDSMGRRVSAAETIVVMKPRPLAPRLTGRNEAFA